MHHLFWVRFNSSFQCFSLIGWCFRMNLSSCAYQIFFLNISLTVYTEIFATVLFLAILSSLSAEECLKFTKKTQLFLSVEERNLHWTKIILHTVFLIKYILFSWGNCVCSLSFVMPCYKQLYHSTISCKLARLHIFSQEGEITKQPTRYLIWAIALILIALSI